MGFLELFLTGIGVSMDAFAVSICKGLNMRKMNYAHAFIYALFFGGFQAIMPLIGWILGTGFKNYITAVDHWIAFILLTIIGGKMLYEAFTKKEEEGVNEEERLNLKEVLIMAIATSIDALAIGVTFAFLGVNIWLAIAVIGVTTFIISYFGVVVGNVFGNKYEKKAEIMGGIILILIGVKLLLEHLGLLG
ncbi:MAG: manganese efflux pump MntP family protein [Lachnospiraceae bacterium]